MNILLEIETSDRNLAFALAGVDGEINTTNRIDVPGPAKIRFEGGTFRKSVGAPEVVNFVLEVGKDVALPLLVAWLYDKLKGKDVTRLRINRTEITRITREGIERIVSEELDEQ